MKPQRNKPINSIVRTSPITRFRRISVPAMLTALLLMLLPAVVELQAAPTESFLLFYSSNIQGETEPCG
jgi:hypothetical protein